MMAVMERCSSDKKESREDADEGDGVMDEGDKSSTTRVTRMALTDSGVVWEGVCRTLDSCIHAMRMFFE